MGRSLLFALMLCASTSAFADPAARGLDAFVLAPDRAAAGSDMSIAVRVYGFERVTAMAPLRGATIEAVWDPQTVGSDVPAVTTTTDGQGWARLAVPVPNGPARRLTLLLAVSHGSHRRTRELHVERILDEQIRLFVAQSSVVPGSTITAWVRAELGQSGRALVGETVELSLVEGGFARWRQRERTGPGGTATFRIEIPKIDRPTFTWSLQAALLRDGAHRATAQRTLSVREETPGVPAMVARFHSTRLLAGESTSATITVRDAVGEPIAGVVVKSWVGSTGTVPADFDAHSMTWLTNLDGEAVVTATAPRVVPPRGGSLQLHARAEVDGHAMKTSASVALEAPRADAILIAEGGWVVPGIEQRMFLTVTDRSGRGVSGVFAVTSDGLATRVTTDVRGEATFTWRVPKGAGANHPSGVCASSVAATVTIAAVGAKGLERHRFERCVKIDRDAEQLLVPSRPIAIAGSPLVVDVRGAPRGRGVLIGVTDGGAVATGTVVDGRGTLITPADSQGRLTISAVIPSAKRPARVAVTSVLVVPNRVPRLTATRLDGAPVGQARIAAHLTDQAGRPLEGTISAVVIDKFGGGHAQGLIAMDTQRALTAGLTVSDARRDGFLFGAIELDDWRRSVMASPWLEPLKPTSDPARTARAQLDDAFARVVRSLEGAVFESTASVDTLMDARRRTARGWALNPELLTLVTAAMSEPPTTPGGEPFALRDLVALDPQVGFDNVAKRVTRLKLFRVLEAVRTVVYDERLLPAEAPIQAPNALLRRLVRDGVLDEAALLDPWGNTLTFVKKRAPPMPFLSVIRGWRLTSAGPDQRLGTKDDFGDPFARVLKSGSIYARAVNEDRVADARYEIVVGDATVAAWRELFETLTGTSLGDSVGIGGLGTSGYGGGGGGIGRGSGRGRVSRGHAIPPATWIAPTRTGADGRVVFDVPLGDADTTWQIIVVAIPDETTPATAVVEVPTLRPLSARVDAGTRWVVGDEIDAQVTLRNRTPSSLTVSLDLSVTGSAQALTSGPPKVEVPAQGTTTVTVRVRAESVGTAKIRVVADSAAMHDEVAHEIAVVPSADRSESWTSSWIDQSAIVELGDVTGDPHGPTRIEIDAGPWAALEASLVAFDPDALRTAEAVADAYESAVRVERWAAVHLANDHPLAVRAKSISLRARGRFAALTDAGSGTLLQRRTAAFDPPDADARKPPKCPDPGHGATVLEAEPFPDDGAVLPCWDAAASRAVNDLITSNHPAEMARAVIALGQRPHRAHMASSLANRVRDVAVAPQGDLLMTLTRRDRATIYAALLIARAVGTPRLSPEALIAGLNRQRGPDGSFGSPTATRAAITAMLSLELRPGKTRRVTVETPGRRPLVLDVKDGGHTRVTLGYGVQRTKVTVAGGPLIARIVQPTLRRWDRALNEPSPLRLAVAWPQGVIVTNVRAVHVSVSHGLTQSRSVDVRIPLPPGVRLAERVDGVHQVAGQLIIRRAVSGTNTPLVLDLPMRFGSSGRFTTPRATAHFVDQYAPAAYAPATTLEVGTKTDI